MADPVAFDPKRPVALSPVSRCGFVLAVIHGRPAEYPWREALRKGRRSRQQA